MRIETTADLDELRALWLERGGRSSVRLMVVGANAAARAFDEALGFRELFVELELRRP